MLTFSLRDLSLGVIAVKRALSVFDEPEENHHLCPIAFPNQARNPPAAAWHATERVRLESRGKPAPFVDGQIAAVASTNQLVLVTLNKKDFIHFEDLEVVNWSERRLRS